MRQNKVYWRDHLINFFIVVGGITIGFAINRLNDNRVEQQNEQKILRQFAQVIKRDLEAYEGYVIPTNEVIINKIDSFIFYYNNEFQSDSANVYFKGISKVSNYHPNVSIYEMAKSSAKLDLISNEDLRLSIVEFYETNVGEAINKGDLILQFYNTQMIPFAINNINHAEYDITQVKGKSKLLNLTYYWKAANDAKLVYYKNSISKNLKELLDKISKELD